MRKILVCLLLTFLPLALYGQTIIEKIEIVGNERVTRETILYYMTAREGDYFSDELLKRDFRILWSTGFFSNIKILDEEGQRGKVLRVILEENPLIKNVSYKTGKRVKEDDIVNKLKEKDETILPYSYYNPAKIQRNVQTIEDLLAEKGLHSAKVDVSTIRKEKNEMDILFKIDEGPRTKVGGVVFVGSPRLPQATLREAMKDNRVHSLISWVLKKDIYKPAKLSEDLELVKKKLQEYGFMEAIVGEPRLEEITRKSILFKKQKMMKIIIPVTAGFIYKAGDVKIDGNKAISTQHLRELIPIQKGKIYSTKSREKCVEDMGEIYRSLGYLYAQIIPVENLDPKRKVVNVTYNVYEGDVCFIRRLDFKGNYYTKDKVIRREMLLREGDRFSLALFKDSMLRVRQLGLVDLEEKEPDIKPVPDNPSLFDVTLHLKELQRNNIQFTAGYSGYEGTFVAMSYSTVNFLGAGETLDITAQYGKRIQNYVFGFSEPYFLDYPITLGFNIYSRYMILPYLYDRKSKGIDFIFGSRLFGYWRTNLTYSYEFVDIKLPETQQSGDAALYYPYSSYVDPTYQSMYGLGNYNVSSLSPTIYRSTVDSPLTPSRGTMYLASLKYAGTFLGGEIHLYKPRFEFTHFMPLWRKHTLGFHLEYQFVKPLKGEEVPFWEKFYLGGERNIRGYDIYTIGPRSEYGTNMGGEKSLVFNAEYIMAVGGPLYLIAFFDMGNSYAQDQNISFRNMYSSTGLEARIFVPALRVPFRLIFAYNNRRIYTSDSFFKVRFAIGTTF
ncbi:MAG: outer membrane protein assembly factor BamA [Candidatus Aminicenantales bacterium]